jgi:hypothetical protein
MACAVGVSGGPSAEELGDAIDKGDDTSRLRPAWEEPRPLVLGSDPLVDEMLHYQPLETSVETTEEGNTTDIDVEFNRPDDAWTEIGRYVINVETETEVIVTLGGFDITSPESAVIATKRWAETEEERELLAVEQTDEFRFQASPGEYRLVVVPMAFTELTDRFIYDISAAAPLTAP